MTHMWKPNFFHTSNLASCFQDCSVAITCAANVFLDIEQHKRTDTSLELICVKCDVDVSPIRAENSYSGAKSFTVIILIKFY